MENIPFDQLGISGVAIAAIYWIVKNFVTSLNAKDAAFLKAMHANQMSFERMTDKQIEAIDKIEDRMNESTKEVGKVTVELKSVSTKIDDFIKNQTP